MTFTDFLRAPVAAKTWREAGYLAASAAVAVIGFTYLFVGTIFGAVLVVTLIGIPLLAAMIVGTRGFGLLHRRLAAALLRLHVDEPPVFAPRPGVLGFVRSCLTDRTGWRAVLFVLIKSMLSVVSVFGALLFSAIAMFLTASPLLWWLIDPVNIDASGTPRRSIAQFGDVYVDSWPGVLALSAVGVVGLFLAPWPIRGLASLDRILIQLLLGPSPRDRRVEELERSRSAVVEDSATRLRRVERDLHDGTQARLVAMAMTLGRAEERIATGQDPSDLVHDAHSAAKDALAELREMVRGIHPPALDLGLGPALETLAARSAVPVELSVAIDPRPSRGTETIAYFTVAELLTNTARHSGATRAWVSAGLHGDSLSVVVRDNGVGGAVVGAGSGLAGLAARAGTVDGSLLVDSPAGGPTVVTLCLPVDGTR
ncbi:sensor histidine kinase [Rhodococcus sp. NPDC059234]|uniref:sensor histidine kinase n=1 Tax=Rhodococcus sp. NPDC059234 TaxID=3346781 RepID=UPI00366DFBE4